MNKHKNPVDGLIEALEYISGGSVRPDLIAETALKEYRKAEQPECKTCNDKGEIPCPDGYAVCKDCAEWEKRKCKDMIGLCPFLPDYYRMQSKLGRLQRQINTIRGNVQKLQSGE